MPDSFLQDDSIAQPLPSTQLEHDQAALHSQLADCHSQIAALQGRIATLEHRCAVLTAKVAAYRRREPTRQTPLKGRDRLLSAIAEVTKDLLETPHIEEAIARALQRIGDAAGINRMALLQERVEESSGRLQHYVVYEWTTPDVPRQSDDPATRVRYNDDYAPLVSELHEGRSIWMVLDDLPEPARSQQAGIAVKSTGAVPIFIEGQYYGAVGFDDCTTYRQWELQEIDMLTSGAGAIGAALHRRQLVERLVDDRLLAEQERAAELARATAALQNTVAALATRRNLDGFIGEVLHTIAKEFDSPLVEYWTTLGSDVVEADTWVYRNQLFSLKQGNEHPSWGGIRLLREYIDVENFMQRRQVFSFEAPIPAYSFAAQQIVCPIDWYAERGVSQHFNFPLQAGDATIGSISVWLPSDRQISEESLRLGQALSHQTALAIQLTRLAEEAKQAAIAREQEHAAQLRVVQLARANATLKQTLDVLAAEPNLDRSLGHVLKVTSEQLNSPSAALWLFNSASDQFFLHLVYLNGDIIPATPENADRLRGQWIRGRDLSRDLAFKAHIHQRAPVIYDVNQSPELTPPQRQFMTRLGVKTLLGVPLLLGSSIVGSFTVRFTETRHVEAEELELTQALAHQATLAIQLLQMAEEAKQAAIFEERNRLAGEIHDTLAQSFTGIAVQLELAKFLVEQRAADAALTDISSTLDRIRELAQAGLAEARRSVWTLYPADEDYADIAQQLSYCLTQMTSGTLLLTDVAIAGEPHPLPPFIGKNLLRIGQEAITNTLKYAHATHLWVELTYACDSISLSIRDDGIGFDTQLVTNGFGLISMSERADRIGGELVITSQPHQGTEIYIRVPCVQNKNQKTLDFG